MNIKFVRLTNGEGVIGDVLEDPKQTAEGKVVIKKPVVFVQTEKGMAMQPYMPFTNAFDEGLEVPRNFVMLILTLKKELEDAYCDATGAILTPGKPKLSLVGV